jgi:Tfp pilus assembly pilus retraction ATPase PilT
MQTLDQCMLELVKNGQVSKTQAWGYAKDKRLFE